METGQYFRGEKETDGDSIVSAREEKTDLDSLVFERGEKTDRDDTEHRCLKKLIQGVYIYSAISSLKLEPPHKFVGEGSRYVNSAVAIEIFANEISPCRFLSVSNVPQVAVSYIVFTKFVEQSVSLFFLIGSAFPVVIVSFFLSCFLIHFVV